MEIVGKESGHVYAGKHGITVTATRSFSDVSLNNVLAVIIPGGLAPDKMWLHEEALALIRQANKDNIGIAAICHAGSVLFSAGIVSERRFTAYRSIRDDLLAANAKWIDEPVVIDGNLITSRTPHDLPQFLPAILDAISA